MAVLYLIFNEGYSASSGDCARPPRAVRRGDPARPLLASLLPDEPEPAGPRGADALPPCPRARADRGRRRCPSCSTTRTGGCGTASLIAEGEAALRGAAGAGWVGVYCLQAAIAREHVRAATAADTDWRAIAALYARPGRGRAVAGGRPEPGGGGLDERGARARASRFVDGLATERACGLPPAARRPGRHAPPARPHGRGARRVPARARARARGRPTGRSSPAAAPSCRQPLSSRRWRARSLLWAGSWASGRCTRWPTARSRARSTTRSASPPSTRSR